MRQFKQNTVLHAHSILENFTQISLIHNRLPFTLCNEIEHFDIECMQSLDLHLLKLRLFICEWQYYYSWLSSEKNSC